MFVKQSHNTFQNEDYGSKWKGHEKKQEAYGPHRSPEQ